MSKQSEKTDNIICTAKYLQGQKKKTFFYLLDLGELIIKDKKNNNNESVKV